MIKYGPAATENSLQGIVPDSDANEVQEFILLLKENSGYFQKQQVNEADIFCDDLSRLLTEFVNSNDKSIMKQIGTEILSKISNILSVIRKKLDYKERQLF